MMVKYDISLMALIIGFKKDKRSWGGIFIKI